jgi:hypothetical protein
MKTTFAKNTEAGAVVLTTTICTFALMSFLVVGYLWMMMEQNKATERSQHWNAALAVAEAGIDEGMAHVDYSFGTNVDLATNGWTLDSTGKYFTRPARSIQGGSYSVIISNTLMPTLISTATVSDKMNATPIKRAVEVTTLPVFAFMYGLTTISNPGVTLKGTQLVITSDVASVYGSINESGGATIYGNVYTGPEGSTNLGPHSSYGTYTNNFYESFPDVQPPITFGQTPPTSTKKVNNGDVTLQGNGTQYYANGDYNVSGKMTITGANVVLYVTGNFSVNSITISPGASLSLYVGSDDPSKTTTATFGQNSGDAINPSPGTPEQFSYFGLPNNTSIQFQNGLTAVSGSFYAPEANVSDIGNMSFWGALLCNTYSANGNVVFNYDPGLGKKGPVIGYGVASWKEIPPP